MYLFFLPPPHKIIFCGLCEKKFKEFTIVKAVNSDNVVIAFSVPISFIGLRLKLFTSNDFGGKDL